MKSLPVLLLLVCISLSVVAAPTFTDQGVDAGFLNPADVEIVAQTVRVSGDTAHNATFNAVQIRNRGIATHLQITKIEIRNGGTTIGAIANPVGLTTTSGVTISVAHTIPKGITHDLSVLVWVANVDAVHGGETLQLDAKFHYLLNGTAKTSAWISDGKGEEIKKSGFEEISDTSPSPNNFNPGDSSAIQTVTFRDLDANTATVTLNKITVRNTGTATHEDIANLKITVTHPGGTWTETKTTALDTWRNGGLVFDPTPDIAIPDDGSVTVTVEAQIAAPTVTVPTDGRTIRNQVTLEVVENLQTFNQAALATTTQTIRRAGVEEIEDDSIVPASGVLNPRELLIQRIVVRDRDVNTDAVTITRIWVKNRGFAEGGDIERISVRSGGALLGTFSGAAITALRTGVWLDIIGVPVADQGNRTFIIEYKIAAEITAGRTLQPQVKVEGQEPGTFLYSSRAADYPALITLFSAGLEIVDDQELEPQTVFSGQRFSAQQIRLKDIDENRDSVTINPVTIRNRGTAADSAVSKIEVRTAAGALLGETEAIGGLSAGGVTVPTLAENVVPDNGEVTLWIWVTFAGPEQTIAGHTLQLETTIFHAEGMMSYQQSVRGAIFTLAINHRPNVDFTYTPTAPTYADTITFTAAVTDPDVPPDTPFTYMWDFGDGNTSTEQNPTHQYPNGGVFDVTLTATDARGLSGSKTKTLTVAGPPNELPTVDFTWSPIAPDIDEEVTFTSTVTDPDQPEGVAFIYLWNFDDETTSTDANPTHSFAERREYTITLTVTDAQGAAITVSKTLSVANEPPVASFTFTAPDPAQVKVGDSIQFTDTSTDPDGTVEGWAWDFGDGTTSTAQHPTHIYAVGDTYTVRLIVTDDKGAKSTAFTKEINVVGPEQIITFSYPNPASTRAHIVYHLPTGATDPVLRIFDLVGRLVYKRELVVGASPYGWDLTSDGGENLPNGLYFFRITAKDADGRTIRSQVFRLLIQR